MGATPKAGASPPARLALRCEPSVLGGVTLEGRIDRIDVHPASGTRQLIDYKTGSPQALKAKVAAPLEDTQLAFYAALLGDDGPLRAIYLALDDRKPPQADRAPRRRGQRRRTRRWPVTRPGRLRDGAGLPALGEAASCEYCEARGLCRRDHWGEVPQ